MAGLHRGWSALCPVCTASTDSWSTDAVHWRLVCTAAGLLDFLGSGPGPGEVAGWLLVVVSRMQPLWDSVRGCWWEGQVTAVERPGSMRLSCLLYTAFPGFPQGGGRGTRPGEKAGRGSHSAAAAPQHRTSCRTGKAPGRAPGGRVVGWSQHKGIRFQQNEENQRPVHGSLGVALVSDLPSSTAAKWAGVGVRRAPGSALWAPPPAPSCWRTALPLVTARLSPTCPQVLPHRPEAAEAPGRPASPPQPSDHSYALLDLDALKKKLFLTLKENERLRKRLKAQRLAMRRVCGRLQASRARPRPEQQS